MSGIKIRGTGKGVPAGIITNADLEGLVDTTDAWITSRTGIQIRRQCDGPSLTDIAVQAGRQALTRSGMDIIARKAKEEWRCLTVKRRQA